MSRCACSGDGRAILQLDCIDAQPGQSGGVGDSPRCTKPSAVEKASLPVQLSRVPSPAAPHAAVPTVRHLPCFL
jgi:hypothetical protein